MQPIGFLRPWGDGYVVVGDCCATTEQQASLPAIYEVNILPYQQPCHLCGRPLVTANANFQVLFDGQSPVRPREDEQTVTVSQLKREAARLIALGQMPSLDEFLDAITKARKKYTAGLRALWREELANALKARKR